MIILFGICFQSVGMAKPIETYTVTTLTMGDTACYVGFTDDKGKLHEEMAVFEMCEQEKFKNKKVIFSYIEENVMAAECQGDPECTKSDTVKLINSIKIIDE